MRTPKEANHFPKDLIINKFFHIEYVNSNGNVAYYSENHKGKELFTKFRDKLNIVQM